jgi:transcriptional regulator of arginine metabolism
MSMSKKLEDIQRRHTAIKSLIAAHTIASQTELAAALRRMRIQVTQATLSRDLTELGIARVPHEGGHRYELRPTGAEDTFKAHLAEEIVSLDANENTVVLKTFPGRASGVALLLDRQQDPELLGTIAGDDTVLVIPRSTKRIKTTMEHIKRYTGL